MVMARSSVHRRDDTLDLVQVVPKVDKIVPVFTTTWPTRVQSKARLLLVLGSIDSAPAARYWARGVLLRPHLGAPRGASVRFSRVLKRTTSKGM